MTDTLNRRRFFGAAAATGATMAGAGVLSSTASAADRTLSYRGRRGNSPPRDPIGDEPTRTVPAESIGIQLYTMRRVMDTPARARVALNRLGRLGYREVELAGNYGFTAPALRRILDGNDLRAVSSHDAVNLEPGDGWQDDYRATCEYGAELGQSYTGLAWQGGPHTEEHYRFLTERLNEAGAIAQEAGLQFFYHNHDFEFTNRTADGAPLYDVLLAETDPDLVAFELDLYWIIVAGESPVHYIGDDPARYPLYHVKDKTWRTRGDQADWEDVGPGSIDFPDIFAAGHVDGMTKHFVIEHDDPQLSHPDDNDAEFRSAAAGVGYLDHVRF